MRTASVTATVEVAGAFVERRSDSMMPVAALGGLGVIMMMAVMMWH